MFILAQASDLFCGFLLGKSTGGIGIKNSSVERKIH